VALTDGRHVGLPLPAVLGICAVILAPTLTYRLGVDQGVFAYMGNALLQGAWPYVHTWESDFPGLVFLQAVEILLFGRSVAAFRGFDLLVQLLNAYLVFRIAEHVSGRVAGLVAAVLFCLVYQGYGPWNTAQREGFGLAFVLTGYRAYFTAHRRPLLVTAAIIGAGLGIAVAIKPTLLALAAFYLPIAFELTHRRALAAGAVALAAFAAVPAVIVGGYWVSGHFTDLYEACVAYQSIYTARLRGDAPLVVYWIDKLSRLGLNAVVLGIASIPFLFRGPARRERVMIWLGFVGSIYAVFVQGTYAGYHYLPGLMLGSVLIGGMFVVLSGPVVGARVIRVAGREIAASVALALVLLSVAGVYYLRRAPFRSLVTLQFLNPPRPNEFRNRTVFDFTESYDVAAYLRTRTRPGDLIQVWGYESLVYYLADRRAASRFQMTHPLVMRVPGSDLTPMQRRWRSEFVRDLEARKPVYVAVVTGDNWWWAPGEQSSRELLDDFPEWKSIIERDYALETTIGRFLIYHRLAAESLPVTRPAG
jgi:hypothetical protein